MNMKSNTLKITFCFVLTDPACLASFNLLSTMLTMPQNLPDLKLHTIAPNEHWQAFFY